MRKLNMTSRIDIVRFAILQGWLQGQLNFDKPLGIFPIVIAHLPISSDLPLDHNLFIDRGEKTEDLTV